MKHLTQVTSAELKLLENIRSKDKELTVEQLFNKALGEYWNADRFIQSGWQHEVKLLFQKNISPIFGSLKLSAVKTGEIKRWHKGFESKPTVGNRSLAVLSRLFKFAIEEELLPQNSNPCSIVKKFSERSRKRYASAEEIKKIGEILEREKTHYPSEVAFIHLLMFTGSRPSAIVRMNKKLIQTVEVNGEVYGIYAFDGKTEDETLMLPPAALAALNDLKPGTKMPRYLWDRIKKEAGCPDLWARDWRRTFATIGLSSGISGGIVGELLNHKSAQTTKIYAKLADTSRLSAASQISATMADLIHSK